MKKLSLLSTGIVAVLFFFLPSTTFAAAINGDLGTTTGTSVLTGSTTDGGDDYSGLCYSWGNSSPDTAYTWTAPFAGNFTFDTNGSSYDTGLLILNHSDTAVLGCDDDAGDGTDSLATVNLRANQKIIIVIDGYSASRFGDFVLNIATPVDVDSDGAYAGADCDDTNTAIHPGATEIPYDNIDQDCVQGDLVDVDSDGLPKTYYVHALAWVPYVDIDDEYTHARTAINTYFSGYSLTESTTLDAATLSAQLQGKHILFIPEQEYADADQIKNTGASFKDVLTQFTQNGGLIIVLGSDYDVTSNFLTGTQLMNLDEWSHYDSRENFVTVNTASPIMAQTTQMVGLDLSTTYSIADPTQNIQSIVQDGAGKSLILTRDVGKGKVVLIGYDYTETDANAAHVIANAMQLSTIVKLDANDADYDNDGVSTTQDCDDKNSTVGSASNKYYQDKDADTLGNPAVSTLTCTTAVPAGYVTNANDTDDTVPFTQTSNNGSTDTVLSPATILNVSPSRHGIQVTYTDGTVQKYALFSGKGKRNTTIRTISAKHLAVVLNAQGTKMVLVDYTTGKIQDTIEVGTQTSKHNKLKMHTFNGKRGIVITSSSKQNGSQLSVVHLNAKKAKFVAKTQQRFDAQSRVKKTKIHKANISVLDMHGKKHVYTLNTKDTWELVTQ